MKRVMVAVAVVGLAMLAGCGGKKSTTTTTVTVTLSPTSASVNLNQTQQFTATVTNNTNTAVNWTVNGIAGGNQTVGFISSAGLYTAPNAVPTPSTVTVAAVSQADTTQSGTASVTITTAATTATLSVSPNVVTLPAGGQQAFAATVSGNSIAVNWTVSCGQTGGCGSISASGVYTAPLSPPTGGTVNIIAQAKDNSVPSADAVVTIQIANGTLTGQYAFIMRGQSGAASLVAAGSINFDGNGNVTAGTEDVNSGGATTVTINSGTYHISTDGRGNATLQTSAGTVNWQFVVVNHSRVFVIRFDSGVASASGVLELQDTTQFTAAGFSGNYAFNLSGSDASGKPGSLAVAGALTSTGALVISSGFQDINDAGSPSGGAVTGSYGAPSGTTGRGTLSLNGTPYAYYIVDANRVRLLGTSTGAQLVGDAIKQPAGPFANASLHGSLAFATLGSTSTGVFGEGGVITLDGAGNVTIGTIDTNKNGNPQNGLAVVSGTYNVTDTTTGRAAMSMSVGGSTLQYALYPEINGGVSMVEIDTTNVVATRALTQSGSFAAGSFLGNYALRMGGVDFVVNPGEEGLVGQITPNGGSTLSGTVDISDNGVLTHSASASTSSPGYTVGTNGRGSLPLAVNGAPFGTFNLYVVDGKTALFLESDSTRVMAGVALKQF
ncbi:MAG: hypothetical protein ACXVZR_12750 [Terriglobales bacterium]